MTIREIIHILNMTNKTISILAKEVGIAEKRLSIALKAAGYKFSNSGTKGWFYIGEGNEPLDKPIQSFLTVSNAKPPKKNTTQFEDNTESTQNNINIPTRNTEGVFTSEEIQILKGLAQSMKKGNADVLQQAILQLPQDKKVKKTYAIPEEIETRLSNLAASKRLQKSELLSLALLELLKRYEENII
ncbi:hypothetical protein BK709_19555 [Bacillus thuringiensis serovar shandongiensis]|uniref:hypothetical protein n=1 Tax=Bacillus toyonensis TaxID=155322 RepID=UPI000B44B9FC|nr:hypothetical protein [Bacillus toyonensis]MEC2393941.1 hypothetical protein [Bacillus toyonensis]OUB04510.1 hypothetical protein BK709_19555 [Bacillus thuringiensis serovar shandongiensis]